MISPCPCSSQSSAGGAVRSFDRAKKWLYLYPEAGEGGRVGVTRGANKQEMDGRFGICVSFLIDFVFHSMGARSKLANVLVGAIC